VLSTGTSLDTIRFRFHLARHLSISPADVDAFVLGEHGTSSVFLWSAARVGSKKVLDLLGETTSATQSTREELERAVRYANITIIEGIGASQYGIGMVSARLTEMILRDERAVIPIGCYNPAFGVTLSLPSVVGRGGVQRILEPEMSDTERQGLRRSAEAIKTALSHVTLRETSAPGG
jgi:L-lactate dehydrogenase